MNIPDVCYTLAEIIDNVLEHSPYISKSMKDTFTNIMRISQLV